MLMPQLQTKTPMRGPLIGDVQFRGQLALAGQRPAGIGQQSTGGGGRGRGFHDRMGNVLGLLEGATHEDPLPVGVHRGQAMGLCVAVVVQIDAQPLGQGYGIGVRGQAYGENHHVEAFFHAVARLGGIDDAQPVTPVREHRVDARADMAHPVVFPGPDGVLVEILAEGAHVHVEDGRVQLRIAMLLGDYGLLVGVHAAHR